MTAIHYSAARILPRFTGEGDRAQRGGGGGRFFRSNRFAPILPQSLQDRGGGCPLHHPLDGPPSPLYWGGCARHVRGLALCLFAFVSLSEAIAGDITISSPWLRATPKGAPVAGGYAAITNKGADADRLIGASIPMAPKGEIHSMSMTDGIMHMERLDKGLVIPAGKTVELTPGGYHLMFLKPKAVLKEGDKVEGSLTFEKAGTLDVTFPVAEFGAKQAPK